MHVICFTYVCMLNPWGLDNGSDVGGVPQLKEARACSFEELKRCSNNFSEENIIGSGSYGQELISTKPSLPVAYEVTVRTLLEVACKSMQVIYFAYSQIDVKMLFCMDVLNEDVYMRLRKALCTVISTLLEGATVLEDKKAVVGFSLGRAEFLGHVLMRLVRFLWLRWVLGVLDHGPPWPN
ncbi:hypothetical protein Tco_0570050 [Tanacetum coccineum]